MGVSGRTQIGDVFHSCFAHSAGDRLCEKLLFVPSSDKSAFCLVYGDHGWRREAQILGKLFLNYMLSSLIKTIAVSFTCCKVWHVVWHITGNLCLHLLIQYDIVGEVSDFTPVRILLLSFLMAVCRASIIKGSKLTFHSKLDFYFYHVLSWAITGRKIPSHNILPTWQSTAALSAPPSAWRQPTRYPWLFPLDRHMGQPMTCMFKSGPNKMDEILIQQCLYSRIITIVYRSCPSVLS